MNYIEELRTREQTAARFVRAGEVLAELTAAGVELPSVTLFYDASGSLNLGHKRPTKEQTELAVALVQSQRLDRAPNGDYVIRFCEGLRPLERD